MKSFIAGTLIKLVKVNFNLQPFEIKESASSEKCLGLVVDTTGGRVTAMRQALVAPSAI